MGMPNLLLTVNQLHRLLVVAQLVEGAETHRKSSLAGGIPRTRK